MSGRPGPEKTAARPFIGHPRGRPLPREIPARTRRRCAGSTRVASGRPTGRPRRPLPRRSSGRRLDRRPDPAGGVGAGVVGKDGPGSREGRGHRAHPFELRRSLPRQASGQLLPPGRQEVDGEGAPRLDGRQGVGALVDADEDQRRIEGDRAERTHGQPPHLPVVAQCGDHGDAGGEAGHEIPEQRRVDRHGLTLGPGRSPRPASSWWPAPLEDLEDVAVGGPSR